MKEVISFDDNSKKSEILSKMSGIVTFWEGKGEIKIGRPTRTIRQNSAIHVLFNQIAEELNRQGQSFRHDGILKEGIETQWDGYKVKEFIWKPVQMVVTDKDSTTKLTTAEIDKVFAPINQAFATKGIEVRFPSSYDKYLETQKN